MNRITVDGYLGKDAAASKSKTGMSICRFSVADSYKGKNQEPTTTWWNVTCFAEVADACSVLKKGQHVTVEGRADVTETEKDGVKKSWANISANSVSLVLRDKKDKQQTNMDSADDLSQIPF